MIKRGRAFVCIRGSFFFFSFGSGRYGVWISFLFFFLMGLVFGGILLAFGI